MNTFIRARLWDMSYYNIGPVSDTEHNRTVCCPNLRQRHVTLCGNRNVCSELTITSKMSGQKENMKIPISKYVCQKWPSTDLPYTLLTLRVSLKLISRWINVKRSGIMEWSISIAAVNRYIISAMAGCVIPTNCSVTATKRMPFITSIFWFCCH
jgi:hypothetical protein